LIHCEILNNSFKKEKNIQLPVTHCKRIKGKVPGGLREIGLRIVKPDVRIKEMERRSFN